VFFTTGPFSQEREEIWDKALMNVLGDSELRIKQIENHVGRVFRDNLNNVIAIRIPHPHHQSWEKG
jgi:hypothetical protein